ncbi:glycosyltransferase family 4 protein [Hymenobacter wooponensis]|uniref:Glycosyltransferase WbuB n=1 Tax=Hymenobacter wooponensis TaxID=1525360 RepID=A0A4Z0MRN6_9BACT|nr:glycosyltransferase family 4 protein [Hymenobacter wooponensis]TGD82234.1 glycosyltransferase WbuB [Hymenobacter wooponensis]
MKILVSSMTFAPDHSGISLYATDFATYAAEQGHEVTAVTAFSWYPKWVKRPEDEGKLFRTDVYKNIKVLRGYLYVPKKVTTISRMVQEVSFILFAFVNFLRAGKQDTIVLFTTPINLGLLGTIFQKLWGAKLIINVQDLQLDAAKSLGMVGKLPIIEIMNEIEKYSYKKADLTTSISTGMIDIIKRKGITDDKIYLWPNWIDVSEAKDKGIQGKFREKFPQYQGKKIIGYAGNIGIKQGLSVLIDLSERFKDHDDLAFLIIGQGGDLDNLKDYAKSKSIPNLSFIDFLSQEEYFNFLTDADIVFLSQKKDSGDVYFPSKLLGIMAKSKLIFISADKDSEIYKVITHNNLGISSEFGDIDQMQLLLNKYLLNHQEFEIYKSNAYKYVRQFDREVVIKSFLDKVHAISYDKELSAASVSTDLITPLNPPIMQDS